MSEPTLAASKQHAAAAGQNAQHERVCDDTHTPASKSAQTAPVFESALIGEVQSKQNQYFPQLDGLRTLAFAMVFLNHAGQIPAEGPFKWLLTPINQAIAWGHLGVDVFFVLSGFLITRLLLVERAERGSISLPLFYLRRSLRIWPIYYFVLLTTCVALPLIFWNELNQPLYIAFVKANLVPLLFFLGNYSWMMLLPGLPTIKLLIPHLTGVGFIIGPFWTLCIEEQFYLFWPLILSRLKSPRALFAGISLLTCTSIAFRSLFHKYSLTATWAAGPTFLYYVNTLCRLDALMLGALLAMLSVYHARFFSIERRTGTGIAFILAGAFAYTCAFVPSVYNPICKVVSFVFYAALGSATLLYLALSWKPAITIFSKPALAGVGKITYCMYLIHYCVISALYPLFTQTLHMPQSALTWLLHNALALVVTYSLASLSWRYLEGPLNALRHRFARL